MEAGLTLKYDTFKDWGKIDEINSYSTYYNIIGENGNGKLNIFILAALSPFVEGLVSSLPPYIEGCIILPDIDWKHISQVIESLTLPMEDFIITKELADILDINLDNFEENVTKNEEEQVQNNNFRSISNNIQIQDQILDPAFDIKKQNYNRTRTIANEAYVHIYDRGPSDDVSSLMEKRPFIEASSIPSIGIGKKIKLENKKYQENQNITKHNFDSAEAKSIEIVNGKNTDNEDLQVEWEFLQTGKSGKDGILITHRSFIFHRGGNLESQSGLQTFHVCSFKKSGCPATATTCAKIGVNERGEKVKVVRLVKCSLPQVHLSYHEPQEANVVALKMKQDMIALVKDEPRASVASQREDVMLKYKVMYENKEPDFWGKIVAALGRNSSIDQTLTNYRRKVVGHVAKKRRMDFITIKPDNFSKNCQMFNLD